jgi:hypothetical protein
VNTTVLLQVQYSISQTSIQLSRVKPVHPVGVGGNTEVHGWHTIPNIQQDSHLSLIKDEYGMQRNLP